MKIAIRHGQLLCAANQLNEVSDLFLTDGEIISIKYAPDGFCADLEINAKDHYVSPGFIDLWSNLREPGFEYKATITSETKAAVKSGFTTLCCSPVTIPVIDNPAIAEFVQQRALHAGFCRVLPIGALTAELKGEHLSPYAALKKSGCTALTQAEFPINNTRVLRHCLEYAATHDLVVIVQAQDYWLAGFGGVHEGEMSARLGLPAIPSCAETIEIARILALCKLTGARIHFNKISSAESVELIKDAQQQGLKVTAAVSLAHLLYFDSDIRYFNNEFHLSPPLRSQTDQFALRKGLTDGVIQAIVSDHNPHERDAKDAPFMESALGMATLELVLPQVLKLTRENLSLTQVIHAITAAPAQILGLQHYGTLGVGAKADICIFSATDHWEVSKTTWVSRGENIPCLGQEMIGQVKTTISNGKVVYQM